jgi:hypothetical protein
MRPQQPAAVTCGFGGTGHNDTVVRTRVAWPHRRCSIDKENLMFGPITIPYGAQLVFHTIRPKPGVTFDDIELALAELCGAVKATFGDERGGFIAGQVFRCLGGPSDHGVGSARCAAGDVVIATYWRSAARCERAQADAAVRPKFDSLARMCSERQELGFDMLWQCTGIAQVNSATPIGHTRSEAAAEVA